ncbi:unnamed protein product [Oppiella nova]|uniref:Uncharacterized protein n=1 Tax=Oppiella nova TaxID=334625 RepID=A0A7R9MTL1_9ACAR|nr:unnamed protein product [Oppiella nova]CAG2182195.1 unnamed protein product [Oppiella nova]
MHLKPDRPYLKTRRLSTSFR